MLYGCGESPVDSRYVTELPPLPAAWEAVLGSPRWQMEWINDQGLKETKVFSGGGAISLHPTLVSAVSALPFWPEKGIGPGIFKPAGAIFPYDVSGNTIVLSWQCGVDAALYRYLAMTGGGLAESGERAAVSRLPQYFNWPRFRLLFADPSLNAELRADPWLADWESIAAKIAKSGFDKRRLVPEARSSMAIPVGPGPWAGTSPFAAPLLFDGVPAFPVRPAADTWVCAEGLLRCNSAAWIFIAYE